MHIDVCLVVADGGGIGSRIIASSMTKQININITAWENCVKGKSREKTKEK